MKSKLDYPRRKVALYRLDKALVLGARAVAPTVKKKPAKPGKRKRAPARG